MARSAAGHGQRSHGRKGRALLVAVIAGVVVIAAIVVVVVARRGHSPAAIEPAADQPIPSYPASSLAPAHGALFGAWVQPASWAGPDPEQKAVAGFEKTIGRKLAIDQLYTTWAEPMPMPVARWDLRHGSIPMISWAGARTDLLASGAYDSRIRAVARQLKSLHRPVMLRWFAEMNIPGNHAKSVSPASFIAAWRHMHDVFASVGASNVLWVWNPTSSDFPGGIAQRYYPGSSYVDWIGADGYNWAPVLRGATWRSFGQVFSSFYAWGLSTRKPMLIGEFGVMEGAQGAKAAWFRQTDQQLRTDFPAIRAIVYFNSIHPAFGGQDFDWRVTSSHSALTAFRAFARDPYFSARPSI